MTIQKPNLGDAKAAWTNPTWKFGTSPRAIANDAAGATMDRTASVTNTAKLTNSSI